MSKSLLIGLLVAALSGIAGLVWWQSVSYDRNEKQLQQQLDQEKQSRRKNQLYVPKASSSIPVPRWGEAAMSTYL